MINLIWIFEENISRNRPSQKIYSWNRHSAQSHKTQNSKNGKMPKLRCSVKLQFLYYMKKEKPGLMQILQEGEKADLSTKSHGDFLNHSCIRPFGFQL